MYYKIHQPPPIKALDPAQRPGEKLLRCGAAALSDAELLAVLLSPNPGLQNKTLAIASCLLETAKGHLAELSQYLPEEFKSVAGIGDMRASVLCAAMELARRVASAPARECPIVNDPDTAAALFMEDMRHLKKEVLRIALLNLKCRLIGVENISVGSIRAAGFSPRDVFVEAIKRGAHGVILAHNHPSGDPAPSGADLDMTRRIAEGGKILGIGVLDHIIIGDGCYVSLKREGIL